MPAYLKQAGHCTRCEAPFAADAIIYMVREVVVWAVFDGEGLSQMETVAVCEKCLTVTEQTQSTEAGNCGGCGHRLMLATKPKYRDGRQYAFTACCNRCAQGIRRSNEKAQGHPPLDLHPLRHEVCGGACRCQLMLIGVQTARLSAAST